MGFLREGKSSLRLLTQMQAVRRAVAANEIAAKRAAAAEQDVMDMMGEALVTEAAALEVRVPVVSVGGDVSVHATRPVETRAETVPGFAPVPAHLRIVPGE
jgi:hypothetical protein